MNDTFLDVKHVRESFPADHVYCTVPDDDASCMPPFTLTFPVVKVHHNTPSQQHACSESKRLLQVFRGEKGGGCVEGTHAQHVR